MYKEKYKEIDWKRARASLLATQGHLVTAHSRNDTEEVHRLQQIIICSHYTHFLAVRKVTENIGRKTAGADGIIWDTDKKKWEGVLQCRFRQIY